MGCLGGGGGSQDYEEIGGGGDHEKLDTTRKIHDIAEERRSSTLFFRWYSSIWKLLWSDLLAYLLLYLTVSLIYRYGLSPASQEMFEMVILRCRSMGAGDVAFLLGFYVSWVIARWWDQYLGLPFIDELAITLAGVKALDPSEEEGLLYTKRTIIRYSILSYILALRRLSSRLQKRYPDMISLTNTGIVTSSEAALLGDEKAGNLRFQCQSNWWVPIQWCQQLSKADRSISEIGPIYFGILGLIAQFQKGLIKVLHFGHVPIPLAYSQVVHLAVYLYFAAEVVAEQYIVNSHEEVDLIIPIFLIAKFLFYFGWLKVACELYNPFGDDDDDIEIEALVNRHLKIGLLIVDPKCGPPVPGKDSFWNVPEPRIGVDYTFDEEKVKKSDKKIKELVLDKSNTEDVED